MGYSFDYRADTAKQTRKIARDQVESAIDLIEEGGDFNRAVHELRRRCKKVRGLLRLVRPNFKAFDQENAHFRGAANALSASRDAAVMVETYSEAIKAPWAVSIATADKSRLRRVLAKHATDVSAQQNSVRLLAEFAESMNDSLARIKDWTFEGEGFSLIEPGLRETYERLQKGLGKAEKSGAAEDIHDWRKDVKYHWLHMNLLKKCAPEVLGSQRHNLDRLGELLGDHHNLFVLVQTLKTLAPDAPPPILDGLLSRQDELARESFILGHQLVVETPKQATKRFGQFWKLLPEDK